MGKFYRTKVTIDVLSDCPVRNMSIQNVVYEITEGGFSGKVSFSPSKEVTKEKMKKLLISQGSDPEFLLGEDE